MERLFKAMPAVLGDLGKHASIDKAVVFAAWKRCAGEQLCSRTAPLDLIENKLVVVVEDRTWQRNLEELSPQILFKINAELGQGTVKFVEFRIDSKTLAAARNANARLKGDNDLKGTVAPSLMSAAESIEDEALRENFLNAAAAYLANQKKS